MNTLANQTRKTPWIYVWLALYALLTLFSTGRWAIPLAAWLAAIFGLRFFRDQKFWKAFILVYLATLLPTSIAWYGALAFPGPAYLGFIAVNVLFGLAPLILDRLLVPRLKKDGQAPFIATLVFPLASTALEYMMMGSSTLGSFGSSAYSQHGATVFVQLVSITGLWGLGFLTNWLAAVANWAWELDFEWRRVRTGVMVFAAVLLAVATFGAGRLLLTAEAQHSVTVASFTVQTYDFERLFPLSENDPQAFRAETTAIHRRYLENTVQAARRGAQLVLWPEGALFGMNEDVQAAMVEGQKIAQQEHIYLAMPVFSLFPSQSRPAENVLYIVDPTGQIVLRHVKYGGNFIEGTLPGNGELQSVETPFGRLSGVICWDADFQGTVAQAGQMGVDLLLIPARDWLEVKNIHAEMATFRAVENGLTILRQADRGLASVIDPYGRTLARADYYAGEMGFQLQTIPVQSVGTLYPHAGDWFGQLSTACFAIMALWAIAAGIIQKRRGLVEKSAPVNA